MFPEAFRHAPPFLFVVPGVETVDGQLRVRTDLSASNPYIGEGAVPRTVLVETMAQAMAQHGMIGRLGRGVLVQLKNVVFHGDLIANTPAHVYVRPVRVFAKLGIYEAQLFAGDRVVCEGQLTAAHLQDL